MKRWARRGIALGLALGLTLVLLAALVAYHGAPFWHGAGLHPDITVHLDGKVWRLDGWDSAAGLSGGLHAVVAAGVAAAVALVLLLFVLPLVLLLGVGLPLLLAAAGLGVAVLAISSVGALLLSPLILFGLLVWWLLRPARTQGEPPHER